MSKDIIVPGEAEDLDLTANETTVLKLRAQGLTQATIAKAMQVSQPMISKMLATIRAKLALKISSMNQNERIGESVSIYESIREKAWNLYNDSDSGTKEKMDALKLIADSRAREDKFLMEVGAIKRAAKEHNHVVHGTPFLDKLSSEGRVVDVVSDIINSQLTLLEAPSPPEEEVQEEELDD